MMLRGIAEEVDHEIKMLSAQIAAIAPQDAMYFHDEDGAKFRAVVSVTRRLKIDEDMFSLADPQAFRLASETKVSTTRLRKMIEEGTIVGWEQYATYIDQAPSVRFSRVFEDGPQS